MGILNTTPDSFSDGGEYLETDNSVAYALQMVRDGAAMIDIGGESTRPGAHAVAADVEIARTVPVIQALRKKSDVLISIDTSKAEVAHAALDAGADIVNDVTGLLGDPDMAQVCIEARAGVCVMHMQGNPVTMQQNPEYEGGVVAAVQQFFAERLSTLTEMGMDQEAICFDPGIGFGKTVEHNLELIRNLAQLQVERPILLGVSRKSLIGHLLHIDSPADRDVATAAISALAYREGIMLHRVHHVLANVQSLQLAEALS